MMTARVPRPLTLIAALPQVLVSSFSRHDLAAKLLAALNPDLVSCLQFVPKHFVRITLKSFESRQAVLLSGITIESCVLTIFEADPVSVEVSVEHLPIEVTDQDLCDAFTPFGAIQDVRFQKFADSDVLTGTRVLTMSLTCDIPVNVRVLRYPCRVFYRGQPRPCPICRDEGHRASACSLRDRCRRCLQPGHFARDCVAALSEEVSTDEEYEDDDDEEFATGDEEVVAAAPAPTPPTEMPVAAVPAAHVAAVSAAHVAVPAAHVAAVPAARVAAVSAAPVASGRKSGSVASRVKRRVTDITSTRFRWIERCGTEFRDSVLSSGHTPDSHVIDECYHISDGSSILVHCIFDFGVNTFRVLKDVRTFDDVHLYNYSDCVPMRTTFPGIKAVNGPPLAPDIVPLKFPGSS